MLTNYISSVSFIGSVIFIIGLWFGVLRAYDIYRQSRLLLIFITLSTLLTPVFTYMWFIAGGQPQYAEIQAIYGALAGLLIATLFAEFMMTFQKSPATQRVFPPKPVEEHQPAPARLKVKPVEEIKPVQPVLPVQPVEVRKPSPPKLKAKPVEENKPSPPPVLPPKPVEERKPSPPKLKARPMEEQIPLQPVLQVQLVEARNPSPPRMKTRPVEERSQSNENATHSGSLRMFLYFLAFLLIVLFPPYYESLTNSRDWVFITSTNLRPFFALDVAFLMYELVILLAVFSGYEFWRAQS